MGLRGLFGIGLLVMFCGGALVILSADILSSRPVWKFTPWTVAKWAGVAIVIGGAALSFGAAIRLYVLEKRSRK